MTRQQILTQPWPAAGVLILAAVFAAGATACSGIDETDRDGNQLATGETPSIDDVLPKPYREIWAPWRGDLKGMIERRMIRVVAPYGGYMYHFDDGEPRGAAWELANRLEDHLNESLKKNDIGIFVVVIPLSRDRLITALLEGHADVIAADLTMTKMRSRKVAFTRPLLKDINEVIVTGPAADDIVTLDDIAGREIHVRRSSSYFEHLTNLSKSMRRQDLEPLSIVPVDELLETEDILDMINAGMIKITVLDDYKAAFWSGVFPDIKVREDLVVHEGGSIAWAVRKNSRALLEELNLFLSQYGQGTLVGNDTYNRYLDDARDLRCSAKIASSQRLRELADSFQKYGGQYEMDWLKLAAQGLQESRLRQSRRSSAGAVGIMQIKPSTARDPNVGIKDISTIDGNVHAGTKYMRFLMDRYFSEASVNDLDRWLLGLAAYNAGPARVIGMREEAAASGYDPNVWFNHVEIVAARRIGRETVEYVSNVFKYYTGYEMAYAKISESQSRHGEMLATCTKKS